jgi:hypothetical protein
MKKAAASDNLGKAYKINGDDSPLMKAATARSDGFKRGGRMEKRKEGGRIDGDKPKERADKPGRMPKLARGGSPYSAAHALSSRTKGGDAGHE